MRVAAVSGPDHALRPCLCEAAAQGQAFHRKVESYWRHDKATESASPKKESSHARAVSIAGTTASESIRASHPSAAAPSAPA